VAYYFTLPKFTDLTEDQEMALGEINAIAISGGAGTGKTVVSILRHLELMENKNKYSVLVTYTKTLKFYIEMTIQSIENKNTLNTNVLPPSKQIFNLQDFPFNENWRVYEIIIDEAQDLYYNTHLDIKNYAEQISYGADFNQQLYSGRIIEDEIEQLHNNVPCNLQQNFRNTYHILNFVKYILPNFYIPQHTIDELEYENIGFKPIFFITNNSFNKEIEKIIELINEFESNTHNIAILLPFGDSRYDFEQSVDRYYNELLIRGINCSKYYNAMNTNNIYIDNIHITTFKSSKGLEFDTVIIPQLHKMKNNIKNTYTVNQEDYYVAFTRTKKNLYLLSSDKLEFVDNNICDIELLNNSHYNKPKKEVSVFRDMNTDEILF